VNVPELYLVLGVVGVIFLVLFFAIRGERRRREQMREKAALLGYTFEEDRDLESEQYRDLNLFKRGRSRRLRNVLSRRTDRKETVIVDFSWRQGGGKSSSQYSVTVVLQRFPHLFVPGFELRPEGISHKIASWFGYQDIDFPEDPEFSSRYLLRGDNEERIKEIFRMPVRLQLRERTEWSVEGAGEWIAVYRGMRRVKPEELDAFIREAEQLVEIIAGTLVR